jgi:CIC family chloride channel protein
MGLLRRLFASLRSDVIVLLALALVIGGIAALGVVGFRSAIDFFFSQAFSNHGTYIVVFPAIGGLIVGLLIYFLARRPKSSGPAETMIALATRGGRINFKNSVVMILASMATLGSGGSVGPEDPAVEIGSSLSSTIGQRLRISEDGLRTLVACGVAAAISATFNAPIAGIFFAHEIILRRFVTPRLIPIAFSAVIADLVRRGLLGTAPLFPVPEYSIVSNWEFLLYALLGVLAALVAVAFIRSRYKCEDLFNSWKFPEYLKPALGGLLVVFIGLYSIDLLGIGYGGIEGALTPGEFMFGTFIALLALKFVATSLTLGSGGVGGVLAPSLFLGAMLGGAMGCAFHSLFPETVAIAPYALVGMGAVFAAAAQGPITSMLLLFELTRDYSIILPAIVAIALAVLIARALNPETIYTTKARRLGVDLRFWGYVDVMRGITVGEAMTTDFPTVSPKMSVEELTHMLAESGHHGFPVVDEQGCLCGCVTLADVEDAMSKGGSGLTVGDVATKDIIIAYPDQSIYDALARFGGREVGRIPVVDREDETKLLGVLRRHDIIRAYTKAMGEKEPPP